MLPPDKGNVIYLSEWLKHQPWSRMKQKVKEIVRYQLHCYHVDAQAKQHQEERIKQQTLQEIGYSPPKNNS